jgi:hypothetical protein
MDHRQTQTACHFMDGSFVTDKASPGDIDAVVELTTCSEPDQNLWVGAWLRHHEWVKQTFLTDFYPFVAGVGNDFSNFFQYVRVQDAMVRGAPMGTRKGILRIQL